MNESFPVTEPVVLGALDLASRQARLEALARAEHPLCLMCSPTNPLGMRLRFQVEPDGSVSARVPARPVLQGYPEALHGGVIASLLDAAMTHALFSLGVAAMTAELDVRFLAPVDPNREASVHGAVERSSVQLLFDMRAELVQAGQVTARASAKFLVKGITG